MSEIWKWIQENQAGLMVVITFVLATVTGAYVEFTRRLVRRASDQNDHLRREHDLQRVPSVVVHWEGLESFRIQNLSRGHIYVGQPIQANPGPDFLVILDLTDTNRVIAPGGSFTVFVPLEKWGAADIPLQHSMAGDARFVLTITFDREDNDFTHEVKEPKAKNRAKSK